MAGKRSTTPLSVSHPELCKEWHPDKNDGLTPDLVVAGSNKRVWWRCLSGPDHEWQTTVDARTRVGSGCPMCSNKALSVTNSLATVNELVASQWHPTKNGDLTPDKVVSGSHLKVWWICQAGPDHEWQATIESRAGKRPTGCPFCAGKMVSVTNSLVGNNPELAEEWHPTKNGIRTAADITFGSNKKVWWVCPKGIDHEWQATVAERNARGNGCPFCAGYRASTTNSLKVIHPDLADQWHPTKNGDLTPDQFASGSMKRVWWKCPEGPDHEWQVAITSRSGGGRPQTGCPFCSGYKLSVTNSLSVMSPDIATQWHPTKNGDLTPDQVLNGTTKKAWWKCPEGPDHEWENQVVKRSYMTGGCPFCAGYRVSTTNSLSTRSPKLASEWHPTKNGLITPHDVTWGSQKPAWWICNKGPDHEWRASITSRHRGQGCACCAGKKLSVTNSLVSKYPKISAEWHPTKNGDLTPDKFFHTSGKNVWWQCSSNLNHEWRTKIPNRTARNSGCPYCNLRPRSIQEIDLLFELSLFFDIDPEDRKLTDGGRILDCDIIIRKEGLVVEFDGSYWHNSDAMHDRDTAKTEALRRAGWTVIRVREEPLMPTSTCDVPMSLRQDMKLTANDVLLKIEELLGNSIEGIGDYIQSDGLQNNQASKRFVQRLLREKSKVDS